MRNKTEKKKTLIGFIRSAGRFSDDRSPRDVMPPFFLMQAIQLVENRGQAQGILFDMAAGSLSREDLLQGISDHGIRIAVISFDSSYIAESLMICHEMKQKDPEMLCIAVGHAATYCMKEVCYAGGPVDYAIRGEYQCVLNEILSAELKTPGSIERHAENGSIYSRKHNGRSALHIIQDVDSLPLVPSSRKDLQTYYNVIPVPGMKKLSWGWIFTTYGCPNQCIFCTQTVRVTYGSEYRLCSTEKVISEILQLQACGVNIIEFMDDNFTSSRRHVLRICEGIIRNHIKISWGAHVRIDDADHDMLALMKEAGCVYVRCGIESGSAAVIDTMKKTKDAFLWRGRVQKFFEWTRDLGLCTIAYIILGCPGEDQGDVSATKDLVLTVDPDILKVHSFCVYPGSKIFDMEGPDYSLKDLGGLSHHGSYRFHPDAKVRKYWERDFIRSFYFRPGYILKHIRKFAGFYLWNPRCFFIIVKYVWIITRECLFGKIMRKKTTGKEWTKCSVI